MKRRGASSNKLQKLSQASGGYASLRIDSKGDRIYFYFVATYQQEI
ncbi:hypothetical protein [Scytonema hofmannii]|nr:hypothetical protein [Scytonema hofmannii]